MTSDVHAWNISNEQSYTERTNIVLHSTPLEISLPCSLAMQSIGNKREGELIGNKRYQEPMGNK